MKITVNEVLVYTRAVRERLNDLEVLRREVSTIKAQIFGKEERQVIEPQYNPKAVEQKISELRNFLLLADRKIKVSNAKTEVELEFDADKLLAPMQ